MYRLPSSLPEPLLPRVPSGYLAAWSGLFDINDPNADYNTILFLLFENRTWLLIIVAVLAATMSTSAVDSIQNAITDSVGATLVRPFFKQANVTWIRALVVLLNIPPVVVSLKVRQPSTLSRRCSLPHLAPQGAPYHIWQP